MLNEYLSFQWLWFLLWDYLDLGLPWWLSGKESTCHAGDAGDSGSIPGWGRSPGVGHGNPLQYSLQCSERITWTEEPGELQSMGSQRGRHDWATEQAHLDLNLSYLGGQWWREEQRVKRRERGRERKFVLNWILCALQGCMLMMAKNAEGKTCFPLLLHDLPWVGVDRPHTCLP